MKTQILILSALILTATISVNAQTAVKDTTLFFNQKQIHVTDSVDQVKVQVYKTDTTEFKRFMKAFSPMETALRSILLKLSSDLIFLSTKENGRQNFPDTLPV